MKNNLVSIIVEGLGVTTGALRVALVVLVEASDVVVDTFNFISSI